MDNDIVSLVITSKRGHTLNYQTSRKNARDTLIIYHKFLADNKDYILVVVDKDGYKHLELDMREVFYMTINSTIGSS